MNTPDYATQWQVLVGRIAHIERLMTVFGTIFISVIAFAWNHSISSPREYWCVIAFLFTIGLAYLHLTFILVWHGRHIILLEKGSQWKFFLFRTIFHNRPPLFFRSFSSIAIVPSILTSIFAINFSKYAGALIWPLVFVLMLRDCFFAIVVYRILMSTRDDVEIPSDASDVPNHGLH